MYTQSPRQTSWKESRRKRKLGREKHAKNDQQLEERPQVPYSESRGNEGTGAGGKGRLECRRGKHGRDMYEAAELGDERPGSSNQVPLYWLISDLESESEVVMNSALEIVDIAKGRRGSMVCGHRTSTRAQG
jgi:hypothetical protein